MEGGNLGIDETAFTTECDDLSLLSTYYKPQEGHFLRMNKTSAATALASHFAALLQAEHPDFWPETIRALMIHSAIWPNILRKQFLEDEDKKGDVKKLMRVCGYGVPDLEKALYSARNFLTLISESEIQPFRKKGSGCVLNEMHFYELPWPKDVLREREVNTFPDILLSDTSQNLFCIVL